MKRRSLLFWIAFSFCCLTLLVKVGEQIGERYVEDHWDEVNQQKTDDVVFSVQSAFRRYQTETYAAVQHIASRPDIVRELSSGQDRRNLFDILQRSELGPELSVEIYGPQGDLLAWWGRTAGLQHSQIDIQRETSFVSSGSVYSYLTVTVPIIEKDSELGFAVVHRLFDVNYPFSNRFIRRAAFTQTFPQRIDLPARYDFSHQAHRFKIEGMLSIPLHGIAGSIIGYASVDEPSRLAAVENIHAVGRRLTSVLLAILSLVLFLAGMNAVRQSSSFVIRVFGLSGLIWTLRYVWLWVGFPSLFYAEAIFDPQYFASPFGFGIAKSLGELFLTSVALCGSVVAIAYQIMPYLWNRNTLRFPPNPFFRILVVVFNLFLAVLLFLSHRGFTAALHSAVFDSILKYHDPTVVLPDSHLAIMLINLLFIALAFVLAAICLISAAFHGAEKVSRSGVWQGVLVLGSFSVAGFLFGIMHPNPLVGQLPRLITLVGFFFIVIYLRRHIRGEKVAEFLDFRIVITSCAAAVAILVVQIDNEVHERERRDIELLAIDIGRPADAWLSFVLQQALREMRGDEAIGMLTSEDSEELRTLSFTQWAKSILSREGYNCSVLFRDPEGHVVSVFRVGMPQVESSIFADFLASVQQPSSPFSISVREQTGPFGKQKIYSGLAAVSREKGQTVGSVEVILSAGERTLFRGEAPPILRSSGREEVEQYLRPVVISEFINGTLMYTTADDIPLSHRLPNHILSRLEAGENFWTKDQIGSSDYETFYHWADKTPGRNVVLALSWKTADWRWHLFDFLRYILFYLLVFIASALLFLLVIGLQGYRVRMSFRTKLLMAFFIVSLVPVVLLAYYNREITVERADQAILEQLTGETSTIRNHILNELARDFSLDRTVVEMINDDWCELRAVEIGTDFSIHVGVEETASSTPELFQAEILENRLSGGAFMHVVLEQENFYTEKRMIGNYAYLVGYRPLALPTGGRFAVLAVPLLYTQLEIAEDLARRTALLFGAYALVMLLAVTVGTIFANQISSPVRQLITATRHIARGELDFHIPTTRTDEIGELHQAFNSMTADLKKNREALIKAERELAWKEMAKQVAHEIKNPLTPMKLSIQHLRQAFRDKEKNFGKLLEHVTRTIIDQADALSRIATQFAHFAQMPERREEDIDIQEVLAEAAKLFAEHRDVTIQLRHTADRLTIRADREELRRAFINIIRNAVQAMNEKGTIIITSREKEDAAEILISDSGPGIREDIRHKLFEPNFSTKSEGMGLGLAIVKKTIDDLRGTIDIHSEAGKGTTVAICLPKQIPKM